ncbi:MAG: alpha/beta fold hydrolase [Gemmataceae bacterium]
MTASLLDFRPLPLLGNPHVQTIIGAYLPGRTCPPPRRRHHLALDDGDALMLYENTPTEWKPGGPVVLLLHGLTGDHASTHIRRMAWVCLQRGARVYRIDLRGAGNTLPLCRRTYHAGRTEDVRRALEWMHEQCPGSPLLLAGMSLGGNMALKLAAEAATEPVPGLARVAAINPPIDLLRCAALLRQPSNRMYERRFLRGLVLNVYRRCRYFPDMPKPAFRRDMTIIDFDDLVTAPQNGFASAVDYYTRASSFPLIHRTTLPTWILTSRDDPFIAVEPFEELRVPDHVQVHILPFGGHVGFVGWDGSGGIRWAEQRTMEWLIG